MKTKLEPNEIGRSVIAVPPLARNDDLTINLEANKSIAQHLEDGGIRSILYGGNANFYHIRLSEYGDLLAMIRDITSEDTWAIPSVGPAYGMMMDQARIVREFDFPTVMILPHRDLATAQGIATAVRHFVEAAGIPIVLYIKQEGWIDVPSVKQLVDDGLVSMIKYAIVLDDPKDDPYLRELVDVVDRKLIVSGIGEQPTMEHLGEFGLNCFTSGCVCVAPKLSMQMLASLKANDLAEAERIRGLFQPLEDLRNQIHPVRVLHDAVRLAGIADTGPILPMLSSTSVESQQSIKSAATELKSFE